MAISDIFAVWASSLDLWIRLISDYQIRAIAGCKLYYFLLHGSHEASAFLLVCITVERFIIVYLPLHSKTICTIKNTKIVIACLFCTVFAINGFHFAARANYCVFTSESMAFFYKKIFLMIHAWLYSYVPSSIILILNVFIVIRMIRSKEQLNKSEVNKYNVPFSECNCI